MGKKGRKKRTVKDDNKEQPPPPETTDARRIAVAAYEKEDYHGALEAIKNRESAYKNNVFCIHAEAFLHYKLAMKNEDAKTVNDHRKEAAISASRAAELCSNSTNVAHFSASMLYILACLNNDHRNYDRVIQECERALAIQYVEDPDSDSFIFKDLSQEMGIEKITLELEEIIKQCRYKKEWFLADPKKRFEEYMRETIKRVQQNNDRIESTKKSASLLPEVEDRKIKQASRKLMANLDEQEKLTSFWRNMSSEDKTKLFEVSTEDLKTHLCLLKDHEAMDLVLEAVEFYKIRKTWKFWECFYCCVKFSDVDSYTDHLSNNHDWAIPCEVVSFLPLQADDVSVEIIMKGEWKPVNTKDLIKVMAKQFLFGSKHDKDLQSSVGSPWDLKWPLSDDRGCTKLLEDIRSMLQLLLRYNYLMQDHVDRLIGLSVKMLNLPVLDARLESLGLKNLMLLCFLELSPLQSVLQFLKSLSDAFVFEENLQLPFSMDEQLCNGWDFDIKGKVVLSGDFLCLLLDEQLLQGELNRANYLDSVDSSVGSDEILSQLYTGREVWKELETWTRIRGYQQEVVKEIFHIFRLERSNSAHMSVERLEHGKKLSAVQRVQSMCEEEFERRKRNPQSMGKTSESLLIELRTNFKESTDYAGNDYHYGLDFISKILEMGQTATVYQQEIKSKLQENSNLSDDLETKILECLSDLSVGVEVDNVTITVSVDVMKKYALQVVEESACDYRFVMVPILKSFIQSRLQELVLKDFKETESRKDAQQTDYPVSDIGISRTADEEKQQKEEVLDGNWVQQNLDNFENKMGTAPADVEDETGQWFIVNRKKKKKKKTADSKKDETNIGRENPVNGIEVALKVNTLGTGLKNENLDCFLNVIIQCLWHLREFPQEFRNRFKAHRKHIVTSCIICALNGIFDALGEGKAVATTSLKIALINRYPDKRDTWMGQMNDASEFLSIILESLDKLLISDLKLGEEAFMDCFLIDCFVHRIFGMDRHESINCVECNVESMHLIHSSFSVIIHADNLTKMKITGGEKSFDELLKLDMNAPSRCGGCEQENNMYYTLRCLPHVFTIDFRWQESCELSSEDISTFLNALSTDLDLNVLFQECPPDNKYFLISLVCFSSGRKHYICFIYKHELQKYIKFDDERVEAIGSWKEVVETCSRGIWQPTIMFFHQKSRIQFGDCQS